MAGRLEHQLALTVTSVVRSKFGTKLGVKVLIWPGGRASLAREIGRIAAAYVSDVKPLSDSVAVSQQDGGSPSAVLVTGHRRDAGFWPLLARVAHSRGDDKASPALE